MANDRIALVTGANRGLGFEICRQLGGQGHTVIVASRDPDKGEAAAEKLRAEGIDAHALQLDVADSASIVAATDTVAKQFGVLDVLVNNAGTFVEEWGTLPSAVTVAQMRETFDTNFFGPLEVLREFIPLMRKSKAGRVVNVSSDMGSLANINNPESIVYDVMGPAYQASKVAINALTTLFAKEFKDTNFKVNSSSPGWSRTDMGGEEAPLSPAEGADTAVWLATLPDDGPTGGFFSATRERGAMEW
ncbi:MAG: SDR family oxidoreductase [Gammaproteobacteria bacterium]|nr:SDR family oxidoreductase [Gammaproteobacteria bacterium]